jgi:hypothetical protein
MRPLSAMSSLIAVVLSSGAVLAQSSQPMSVLAGGQGRITDLQLTERPFIVPIVL